MRARGQFRCTVTEPACWAAFRWAGVDALVECEWRKGVDVSGGGLSGKVGVGLPKDLVATGVMAGGALDGRSYAWIDAIGWPKVPGTTVKGRGRH